MQSAMKYIHFLVGLLLIFSFKSSVESRNIGGLIDGLPFVGGLLKSPLLGAVNTEIQATVAVSTITVPTGPTITVPTGPTVTPPTVPTITVPTGPTVTVPTVPTITVPTGPTVTVPAGPAAVDAKINSIIKT